MRSRAASFSFAIFPPTIYIWLGRERGPLGWMGGNRRIYAGGGVLSRSVKESRLSSHALALAMLKPHDSPRKRTADPLVNWRPYSRRRVSKGRPSSEQRASTANWWSERSGRPD